MGSKLNLSGLRDLLLKLLGRKAPSAEKSIAMTKVTILGSGITGMAIASQLPKGYDITIVARDLPGDAPTEDWASPWACAGWVALGGNSREEQMQLDTLAFFRKLAKSHPESGVRCVELTDLHDVGATSSDELWYHNRVPDYKLLDSSRLPESKRSPVAVQYASIVLNPSVFLPWLRKQLESAGVRFQRIQTIKSLNELSHLGHDILINASGDASQSLSDVQDSSIITDRTYTILVKSNYKHAFVRRGASEYVYIFGRGDGTAVLGGISEPVTNDVRSSTAVRGHLIRRAHENLPEDFPSANPADYTIIEDRVGVRPLRLPNVRVEKELVGGQKVVHAYGTTIGGYILGFGIARETARLLDEFVFSF